MAEVPGLAEQPDLRRVLRRSLPFLRPHRRVIVLSIVVSLASTLAVVLIAPAVGFATDALLDRDLQRFWTGIGALVVIVLSRKVLLRRAEILLTEAGERFVRDLRERAVRQLSAAPLRFVEAHRSGELLRRTTSEITDMAGFIRSDLPDLVAAVFTIGLTAAVLLTYSPLLTLAVTVVFAVPALLISKWFNRDAGEVYGKEAAAEATVVATFTEGLAAAEMLQTTGASERWLARASRDSATFLDSVRGLVRVSNRLHGIVLIECVTTAVLVLLAGWLAARGEISVGTVVVFVLASRALFESLTRIVQLVSQFQDSRVALARLLDLLARTATPAQGSAEVEPPARGELVARDVTYSYVAGVRVLHGVSVAFRPGTRTGLAGRTGSGKSTLAKLLTGLYAPDTGSVHFAGHDLAAVPASVLRQRIVLVPQQVHVVAGTLLDNLALTPGSPDRARIERAVSDLGLTSWVDRLPDGLLTDLGARGENLSAGERQLIGLVRAALVDPAVLVLDEATADIDPETAERIEQALELLRTDRVLLVIAHREATLRRLGNIVHLDAGRVVPVSAGA
jgi:ATP-binding cassette, subfamily B, bacterial